MNLSARLDEARKQRAKGQPNDAARHLDLRFAEEEGRHYEGREIRTGETLDESSWQNRDTATSRGLPRWNPRRAARPEVSPESAEVIDLTDQRAADPPPPAAASTAPIELPAWAQDRELYRPPTASLRPVDGTACTNCGGEPRVDVLDLLNAVARVECRNCGMRWEAPAGDFQEQP